MRRHASSRLLLIVVSAALIATGFQSTASAQANPSTVSAIAVPLSIAGPASAAPGDYSITGIDVSHHQGSINWSSVAGSGIDFAYAKTTEGLNFVDGNYAANRSGARAAGLYFGAYAFGRPDQGSPRTQADKLVDTSQYSQDGRTLPPMLDIEWGPTSACYGLSTSAMVSWISQFLDQVKIRTGQKAMIYTNPNWWNPCTGSSTAFGSYPLFHSRYGSEPGTLPAGWSSWTAWQYTDSGTVPGVSGNTDRDVFHGSLAELAALCGATDPPEAHGTVWDRGRSVSGVWSATATQIDFGGWVTDVSASALPDGTVHVQTVVPGSGVWDRTRWNDGSWSGATLIDENGSISAVSSAVLADGSLHVQTVVAGAGVWDRARSAAGVWDASATKIDSNGSVTDVAAAGLPNGTLHVLAVVPGSGVWDRIRWAGGSWDASATRIDSNGSLTDVSAVGLADGSLQVQVLLPNSGIWNRARSAAGVWDAGALRIDTNPYTTAISAAGLPDGTVHVDAAVPGSGVWHRVRSVAGSWATGATRIDTNGSIFDVYTAGLRDGTLHVGTIPNS